MRQSSCDCFSDLKSQALRVQSEVVNNVNNRIKYSNIIKVKSRQQQNTFVYFLFQLCTFWFNFNFNFNFNSGKKLKKKLHRTFNKQYRVAQTNGLNS